MENLTVIIPVHDFSKNNFKLLCNAIESVPENLKIIVSTTEKTRKKTHSKPEDEVQIVEEVGSTLDTRVEFLTTSTGSSFCELVNAAVDTLEDGWFSILEFDDTYTDIWYDNVKKYLEFKPDTSVFMVLEDIKDFNNGKYVGFGNAEAYASAFSNEIGYIDNDCLQNYFDFYLTGSVFNVKDWKNVGGLKHGLKVTFWYEWMLRATSKGKKIFVIPKVGYTHNMDRKGSYVESYRKLANEEVQFYFDLAKKEYFFHPDTDRNLSYEPNKEEKTNEKS